MNRCQFFSAILVFLGPLHAQNPNAFHLEAFVSLDSNAVVYPWVGFASEHGSRGLAAGSDLDGDGKQEIFMGHFDKGSIAAFEMGEHNLELIWVPDTINYNSGYFFQGTRIARTGDLDGDGAGEVIFFRSGDLLSATRGLYIYEYNGTDNGFDLAFHDPLITIGGDSLLDLRIIENFLVNDIDSDGIQELIVPHNGIQSIGPDRAEDFFSILSFPDGFVEGGAGLVEEYWVSPRDVDKDGIIENRLGGGSPVTVAIADTDGDGLPEIFCHVWNWFNNFFIEVVGPDSYTLGDTTYVMGTADIDVDDFSIMQAAVADMNQDGRDEIYLGSFYSGRFFKIEDNDGDATHFTASELDTLPGPPLSTLGAVAYDFTQDGIPEIYFGAHSESGQDIVVWDGVSFEYFLTDPLAVGSVAKLTVADLDGDSRKELVTSHMDLYRSRRHKYILRASEWAKKDTTAPVSPTIVGVTQSAELATITWTRNKDADFLQYIIYGGTEPNPVTPLDTVIVFYDTTVTVDGLPPGGAYYFRLQTLDVGYNASPFSNEVTLSIEGVDELILPKTVRLHQNYPNPFNPVTTLSFELPEASPVSLIIYDLLGREVIQLLEGEMAPGYYRLPWSGRDSFGRQAPSGVYIARMVTPEYSKSIKMVLLK